MTPLLNELLLAEKNKNFGLIYESTDFLRTAIREKDKETLHYLFRLVKKYGKDNSSSKRSLKDLFNTYNSSSKRNSKRYLEYHIDKPGLIEDLLKSDIGIFGIVVNEEINLNYKDKKDQSLCCRAVLEGRADIVELLIKNGADVNTVDNNGCSTSYWAIQQGDERMIKAILSKVNGNTIKTLLYKLVCEGCQENVELLTKNAADLNIKIDVNAKYKHELTLMHMAATYGYTDIVAFLAINGANVNAKDVDHFSPMHVAAASGYTDIVGFLKRNGANENAKNKNNQTPRDLAAAYGQSENLNRASSSGPDDYIEAYESNENLNTASNSSSEIPKVYNVEKNHERQRSFSL